MHPTEAFPKITTVASPASLFEAGDRLMTKQSREQREAEAAAAKNAQKGFISQVLAKVRSLFVSTQ